MQGNSYQFFMAKALKQAKVAFDKEEVPIGAVVVDQKGQVIARAYNQVEMRNTQTAHAEMLAIERAGKKLGDWRLARCTLYVTLEPCAMCMGLVILSRLKTVVYGAPSPEFGYHLDSCIVLNLYKKELEIVSNICSEPAQRLLQAFFRKRRSRGREERPGKDRFT